MMSDKPQSHVEFRDIAPGLWIWRLEHPHWKPGQGWEPVVACTCVESGGQRLLLDPLAPPADAAEFWQRFDAHPPTAIVVLKPDHVRDVDLLARRYNAPGFGPRLFFRWDMPETELEFIEPGSQLPGGELRVWKSPSYGKRALPALRALLELPFEHVIVSHGEPVHSRAEFERALA